MIDIVENQALDLNQIQVIVRGMHRVAQADGEHATELVLMREFYEGCRTEVDGLSDFRDIVTTAFDPELAREALSSEELQHAFLKSCFLVGFADGRLSEKERDSILQMADEIGIARAEVERAEELVKEDLLRQLSRIENIDALKDVQQELEGR